MTEEGQGHTQQVLRGRLLTMMVLRVVLAFVFLGVTSWLQFTESHSAETFYPIYAIAAFLGFLTLIYAFLIKRLRRLPRFAYLQITIDVALITFLVHITGGVASYLSILYYLCVIGGSIILGRNGGFYSALISSIAYSLLVLLDFSGMLPDGLRILVAESIVWMELATTLITNVIALFFVAYLTGYLSERMATVEKELEEKVIDLERLEKLNRQVLDNIHSGILTLDAEGRITSFNHAAEEITGYELEEVYNKRAGEVIGRFGGGTIGDVSDGLRCEDKFFVRDGEERYLGYSVSEGTGDMSIVVTFQDLTKLHAMEEQLKRAERLKALGEISAGMAHEIRNPLASISGSIQVLRDELELEGDDSHLMEIVVRETERLNALISDFLLFAKPAREERGMISISDIVGETLTVFGNSPEAQGIEIESELAPDVVLKGDTRQLTQVFWNLFINASNAMNGSGRLRVTLKWTEGDRGSVTVRVIDTGAGISPEDIVRIFDPFYSTRDDGTGLGLAIVHRVIESHGGRIEVENRSSGGTVFVVVLPVDSGEIDAGEGRKSVIENVG